MGPEGVTHQFGIIRDHQDVDVAIGGHAILDQRFHRAGVGHVALGHAHGPALFPHDRLGLARCVQVDVAAIDLRPFAGEQHGHGLAIAPAGPR